MSDSNHIEIIYEDKDMLVLNKPAGLVVHSDGKSKEPTLADWVRERYPGTEGIGEPLVLADGRVIDRPGIVHRLDRETSGAIAIAKNKEAYESLKAQFQNRKTKKVYHAFVYGRPSKDKGTIDAPIGRSKSDFRKRATKEHARGEIREALTEYKVIRGGKKATLIEARPKTGRTHQLRVHLHSIKHPIVRDSLYAPRRERLLGFERLALHAYSLAFTALDGTPIEARAEYPDDFQNALGLIDVDKAA